MSMQGEICNWVILINLDEVISKLETTIYLWAAREHHTQEAADRAVHNPHFSHPAALARNQFLGQRNRIADACGVKHRKIHDSSIGALGYVRWNQTYAVQCGNGTIRPLPFNVEV